MKCKICGHRSNTLKAMGQHYRKKHPTKMKRGKKRISSKIKKVRSYSDVVYGRNLTAREMISYDELIDHLSDIEKNNLIISFVPLGVLLKRVRGF